MLIGLLPYFFFQTDSFSSFNFSNPYQPTLLYTLSSGITYSYSESHARQEISDSRRWIVASTPTPFFYVIDISNPALPVLAWYESASNGVITSAWVNSVQLSYDEQYLFASAESNDIYVYDFRNPYQLTYLYKRTPSALSIAHPTFALKNMYFIGYTSSAKITILVRDYGLEDVVTIPFNYVRKVNTNKLMNKIVYVCSNGASAVAMRVLQCVGDQGQAYSRVLTNFCRCPPGYKDDYAVTKNCIADSTQSYYVRNYNNPTLCAGSTGQPSSRLASKYCSCPEGYM